jgi:hypothetical protein
MRRALAEQEKQRKFAVSEREAGQAFAEKQLGLQQLFARGEREAQQGFARGEREAQQTYATGERLGTEKFADIQSQKDLDFRNKVFSFESGSKLRELDMAEKQFALDKDIAEFNKQIALMEANKPTDLLGSLFGNWASTSSQGAIAGPIGRFVGGAVNVVGSAFKGFCFFRDTLFEMHDGSKTRIQDIRLGDHMKDGGEVYFIAQSYSSDIYLYNGILVTGSHAVFENGQFIRIKDSLMSSKVNFAVDQVVYMLSNENHLMISNGILFSDYDETNDLSLTDDDSLVKLNSKLRGE